MIDELVEKRKEFDHHIDILKTSWQQKVEQISKKEIEIDKRLNGIDDEIKRKKEIIKEQEHLILE